MEDVKFRFVNKIKKTGLISFQYTSINEIEGEDSWQGKVNYVRLAINLYTGLKDKNGKEIYEGDIDESGLIVSYCGDQNEGLGMNVGFYLQRDEFESWIELEAMIGENNYNIIGNIYENPELLARQEAEPK